VAAGCALVLVANLAILAAVAWNRSGETTAELVVTERELMLPDYRQEENSGIFLRLVLTHRTPAAIRRAAHWRRHEIEPVEYEWLDRRKLRELGFRTGVEPDDPEAMDHYAHVTARRVFLAVEMDGEAWSRWLAGREGELEELRRRVREGVAERSELENEEALLALDRSMRSRLFPVDAATDARALRVRYPDGRRHTVIVGVIRPRLVEPTDGSPYLTGSVRYLSVGQIRVPPKLRDRLEAFLPTATRRETAERSRRQAEAGWPSPAEPRYRAVVAFGRRHEPWLVSLDVIQGIR
jgi:hypothetical protein